MKTPFSTRFSSNSFKLLLLSVFMFLSLTSEATRFRYGSISWRQVSGNTYEFKVTQAWRRTYSQFGLPNVGSVVNTDANLMFGDGLSSPINLTVSSVNIVEDWFFGEAIIRHTYASAGDRDVYFTNCCRINGLINIDPAQGFRVSTKVNVGSNNDSPVTSVSPIVNVEINTLQKFFVPFADPDGDALTYRFATAAEMNALSYTVPSGTVINFLTGEVTMNTNGFTIASLYSLGVIASDGLTSSKADFIVKVVPQITNGIDQQYSKNNPLVYPNPCKDMLYVEAEEVSIFDVFGSEVVCPFAKGKIDVSTLQPGIYYVFLKQDLKTQVVKFIIE